jgi:molybdopterin molybdotransferase
MEFFTVLPVLEVLSIIEKLSQNYSFGTEMVDLLDSTQRITSKEYLAPQDLPEFDRSTVDGYAVMSQDVCGASPTIPSFLQYVKEVSIGKVVDWTLIQGQAVYVPTGGMIPQEADGVVMIEYVEKLDEQTILIYKPIAQGENLTFIGDDLKKGELILQKGKKITPYDIGLLAGMGIRQVEVYKKPRFFIISTGDEIIDLNEPQQLSQIRDINGYVLSAVITQVGGEVVDRVIVKDDFCLLQKMVERGVHEADLVLISGGSSVGIHDYTKQVIESFDTGQVLVHGIAIKPGKPTIIGQIQEKIVFGLPGHPVSALMIFEIFVKKYMQKVLSIPQKSFSISAVLESNVHAAPGKETYQMVQVIKEDHKWKAVPLYGKSGMMTLLSRASGYIRIADDQEGIQKGELVDVFLFQEVNY